MAAIGAHFDLAADGEFSIEAVRCVGCCGLAPVVVVNDEVYGSVNREKLPEILAIHRSRSPVGAGNSNAAT